MSPLEIGETCGFSDYVVLGIAMLSMTASAVVVSMPATFGASAWLLSALACATLHPAGLPGTCPYRAPLKQLASTAPRLTCAVIFASCAACLVVAVLLADTTLAVLQFIVGDMGLCGGESSSSRPMGYEVLLFFARAALVFAPGAVASYCIWSLLKKGSEPKLEASLAASDVAART